ncbi:hypothetical protein [Desulfosporosinus sp. BG]|uniref:hypothetical protein n=1 Tax=Desulfosporosinus sp. BG TaxID=1633135 RepID=UPI00083A40B4|nr:hypothetical protein [Desulfosporosinus sp. BG]ODA39702.1 Flagellar hook-length control protein FliK [Desulfosporosinus sp. BG]
MPYLTTGLLDNTIVAGERPSSTLMLEIANEDISTVVIQIEGFLQNETTKVKYVDEFFTLAAGTVAQRSYYTPFDAFEFQFFVSSQFVNVAVWRNDVTGKLNSPYRVVTEEVNPI